MKYDIVSIGDCAIDAFIEIEEAHLHYHKHHQHPELMMNFADKIPYKSLHMLSAGNANNVAVGMARLGFKTGYYGTIGDDHNGRTILGRLKDEGVGRDLMHIQKNRPTNFHFVLWFHHDRTILIKHQEYDYKLPKGAADTKWIYMTHAGQRGLVLHPQVVKMLQKNPKIKMSFNPGTYQLRLGLKKLLPMFKHTEILFVNKEEAELLVGRDGDYAMLSRELHKAGPKIVVITDALKGSWVSDGSGMYHIGVYPHVPYETTGCGDAYATGFTAAMMRGLGVQEALRWGARNGASVAQVIGPQDGLVYYKNMLRDLKRHPEVKARIVK